MSTVQTPPRPPEVENDIDAGVIEEARARQRKQRRAGALVALAAVIAGGLLVAFGGGGGHAGGGHVSNGNGGEPGGFASHIVIGAPGAATGAQIAAATSGCENEGGYPTYTPGRVVLAQASARYTALISLAGGYAFECLYGHIGKLRAVAWHDLDLTGTAPAADKLNAQINFLAGGGSFPGAPFQHGKPRRRHNGALGHRPHITRAERAFAIRRSEGLGFGDYALGQAGKAVTAVKVRFANGTTVDATVQHGWYFVWWPGFTNPRFIEVVTKSGTETSPMTSTGIYSPLAGPGCRPGTNRCPFERTRE
jgi:hypothetical protein